MSVHISLASSLGQTSNVNMAAELHRAQLGDRQTPVSKPHAASSGNTEGDIPWMKSSLRTFLPRAGEKKDKKQGV